MATSVSLATVIKRLNLSVFTRRVSLERDITLACASDLMSDVLAFSKPHMLLITALISNQSVRTALIADATAILYTRGKKPDKSVLDMAERLGLPLIGTELDTFDICGKLYEIGIRNRQ